MTAIAYFIAITGYLAATALAVTPFARRVHPPVRGVCAMLTVGITAHLVALGELMRQWGTAPVTGLGPALSFAGCALAVVLLVVELVARDVSLTLAAAPLAAVVTMGANLIGMRPFIAPAAGRSLWLVLHIILAFFGIAAYATAAIAGVMYLVARRQLKARHFGAIFRFFPPLETLDRVNHLALLGGLLGLTLGIALAVAYSAVYGTIPMLQLVWGLGAWLTVAALTTGRLWGGWQARRAAVLTTAAFVAVIAAYVLFRIGVPGRGQFL